MMEHLAEHLSPDDLGLLTAHGDRTNSLAALSTAFSSWPRSGGPGAVRFLRARGWRVAAGEPLAPARDRAALLADWAAAETSPCLVMPVGKGLAEELRARGFSVWQAGSEPIFDLAQWFALLDPLLHFPVARALQKRGAEVAEADLAAMEPQAAEELRRTFARMAGEWLQDKSCLPLSFLSRVAPLEHAAHKRFFVLRVRGEVQAFIAASPVFPGDGGAAPRGWYLQDIIRRPDARAGAGDLLIIETMRLLHSEGAAEARLGMAPLAGIAPGPGAGLLGLLFRHWRWGYNFASLHEFKQKFQPTRWDPLYMASSGPGLVPALLTALRAHFPDGLARASAHVLHADTGLALAPRALHRLGVPSGSALLPLGMRDYLRRTRCVTALVLLFTVLHLARSVSPGLETLYAVSPYVPGHVTWQGLLLGPLFHNHLFHLVGDQLTFYAAGALIEVILGSRAFLLLTAAGLWLSNPLTQALVQPALALLRPDDLPAFLAERDWGSSNAAFALVGAYAALLRRQGWLLLPFTIYGIFICVARESWLGLHHLLTMGLGYAAVAAWIGRETTEKGRREG